MPESNTQVNKDGSFIYGRVSFDSASQDSAQSPPAQNEEMFELLENVLPPRNGDFQRRWGYELFNNPSLTARRMYEFQDDEGTRAIVLSATTNVESLTEAGATHNTAIFTPTSPTRPPRMAMSRGYGYFADGVAADLKKWDGTPSAGVGVTKWGIEEPRAAVSGPRNPTVAAEVGSGNAWTNPGNMFSSNDARATNSVTAASSFQATKELHNNTFGFSLSGSNAILGVVVELEYTATYAGDCEFRIGLAKVTGATGTPKSIAAKASEGYVTFGSSTDLWGATWNPLEINSAGFGAYLYGEATDGTCSISADHVRISIYHTGGITIASTADAGLVTLVSGRKYFYVYQNTVSGHVSDLSAVSASTGPITLKDIDLTGILDSADTQVDLKILLATADGGDETLLYEVDTIAQGTTTYTDNVPETDLLTRNIWVEVDDFGFEQGLAENDPPPNGDFPTPHRGRMYMAVGELLYFSKSIEELTTSTGVIAGRWEESWPGDFFLDVSAGAETIRGLMSDGQTLYIGTERRVIRLFGDGPQNFSKPEVAFNDVGILNQEVWKPVFRQGSPVGAMWLTPDMRLIFSDMNSYALVGTPIQDILDSINTAVAEDVAWAAYTGQGKQNFYLLAVPTGVNTEPDTLIVYDLTQNRFVVWRLLDKMTAGLNNITATGVTQFLFAADTGKVYNFDDAAVQDRVGDTPANFTATIRTSFQHFGNPLVRKHLDWMQVLTGDAGLLVTVEGASTKAEYDSPSAVVTDAALYANPLGDYQVALAGDVSKDRSYRFQFESTAQVVDILSGLFIQGKYIHAH